MDFYIVVIFSLMNKMAFSPLVLIGLLITSLSLILNLKDTNMYIKKFKEHKNITMFINRIFYTSLILLLMFMISIIASFINQNVFLAGIYIICLIILVWNLFIIIYTLKEIVRTSLKDDS